MKFIKVSEDNAFPKYQQIINSVEKSIANQLLKKNDPDLNLDSSFRRRQFATRKMQTDSLRSQTYP